ncbi:MAG TPA: AEC family transporter [Sphaerochaeta sp.]|nr:AEC family transporter [Sphaerochaeta sp.]
MIFYSFMQMLPILLLSLGGYVFARLYAIDLDTLVVIISDLFMPALIFISLYKSDIHPSLVLDLAGATTLIVILLTLTSFLYAKAFKLDKRSFMPSLIFMNSGFLGIPLMQLWGGTPAMNLIVIYDQIQTIFIFTLGILIITGGLTRKSLGTIVKSPILWAVFAGFFFRFSGLVIPSALVTTFEFGGSAAPPLAAFALGVSLKSTKWHLDKHIAGGLVIRFVGGFLFALLATRLFGITGLSRSVVLVASTLPSAVFTSVLPIRYGVRSDFGSTMVIISTILGILTIPLSFLLAG